MTATGGPARAVAARILKAIASDGKTYLKVAPDLLATLPESRDRAFVQTCV